MIALPSSRSAVTDTTGGERRPPLRMQESSWMSSVPREALNTRASEPGVITVPSSMLSVLARSTNSRAPEMSAGVIRFVTSAVA